MSKDSINYSYEDKAKYQLINSSNIIEDTIKKQIFDIQKDSDENNVLYEKEIGINENLKLFLRRNFKSATFKSTQTSKINKTKLQVIQVNTNYIIFQKTLWINGNYVNVSNNIINIINNRALGRIQPEKTSPYFKNLLDEGDAFVFKGNKFVGNLSWNKIIVYGYQIIEK